MGLISVENLVMSRQSWLLMNVCLAGGLAALFPSPVRSADRATKGDEPAIEIVDLFSAIERGEITAKIIPKDETRVKLLLTNGSHRPLSVRIPAAIAAVPALGQNFGAFNNGGNGFFGGNGLQANQGQGAGGGRNQALGIGGGNGQGNGLGVGNMIGGAAGNGFPRGNNGFPGGVFNVPEGRVTKIDLPAVCLEHGKRAPHHGIPYELRPLEQLTSDPLVVSLVETLNDPKLDREIVQVAAWRLTSGWTWEQMREMTVRRPWGAVEPKFAPSVLAAAQKLTKGLSPVNDRVASQSGQSIP